MRTPMQLLAVLGFAVMSATLGCAEGSPADPVTKIDPPPPPVVVLCGNGKLDASEECDCPNVMTKGQCKVDNMSCAMLRPGSTGTLLCNAAPMCTFNLTMCSGGAPGTGGTGR
jgi:hypothetical protein